MGYTRLSISKQKVPKRSHLVMKIYNIAISWNSKEDSYFEKLIRGICRTKGLSFLWIHDDNIKTILRKLFSSDLRIDILLDTEATYNDPEDMYSRLCYAVKDRDGIVINDPDNTRVATDKAFMYYKLLDNNILTPYTLIARSWQPKNMRLTKAQREQLGMPFVIKPSQGYGQRGLIRNATGSSYGINKARRFDEKDDFLLQKKINPYFYNGKKGWFRVFRLFDKIIPCWWDDATNRYEHVTKDEFKKHNLKPLSETTIKIAELTSIVWFSTEIVVVKGKSSPQSYVCIDYVNDQCDMTPISQVPNGVPNHVVDFTARVMVENAKRLITSRSRYKAKSYELYLG